MAVSIKIGVTWGRTKGSADLEPVDIRQHQIEDDSIKCFIPMLLQPFTAIFGDGHGKIEATEIIADHLSKSFVVIDEKDLRCHLDLIAPDFPELYRHRPTLDFIKATQGFDSLSPA